MYLLLHLAFMIYSSASSSFRFHVFHDSMCLQFASAAYLFRVSFSYDFLSPRLPILCLVLGARFNLPFLHTFGDNARVILFNACFLSVLLLPVLLYLFPSPRTYYFVLHCAVPGLPYSSPPASPLLVFPPFSGCGPHAFPQAMPPFSRCVITIEMSIQ